MARGETKDEKDYWKTVENIAREAFDEVKGDLDDEKFTEFVEQSVEGSEFVIYTNHNINVMKFSDTDLEAPVEELGWEGLVEGVDSVSGLLARLAFSYMVGDVQDYVQRHAEEWGSGEEAADDED